MSELRYMMDMLSTISQEYEKVLFINLTTFKFTELKSNCNLTEEKDDIRDWLRDHYSSRISFESNVHTINDIYDIKDYFAESGQRLSFRIKRNNPDNSVTWFSITIYKAPLYNLSNEYVVLLVRNIEDEYCDILSRQHELEELSYTDKLTDIGNRRALEEFMHSKRRQIGVVYIDLNGLKETNDKLGHAYGDALICQCSALLINHFRKTECYRIGGDEFVIAAENVSEDVFIRKVDQLRNDAKLKNINISIGFEWSNGKNIDHLIDQAEQRMRQNKNIYYKSHTRYR